MAPRNPPAFPQPLLETKDGSVVSAVSQDSPDDQGMSLRDYFAATALNAIVLNVSVKELTELLEGVRSGGREAKAAYLLADAMLAQRERGNGCARCGEPARSGADGRVELAAGLRA